VEERGKRLPALGMANDRQHGQSGPTALQNPLSQPQFGRWGCETGFRRGFSQLTFSTERGEYLPSGFPNSDTTFVLPVLCWV
jgi:hypothetical protein